MCADNTLTIEELQHMARCRKLISLSLSRQDVPNPLGITLEGLQATLRVYIYSRTWGTGILCVPMTTNDVADPLRFT